MRRKRIIITILFAVATLWIWLHNTLQKNKALQQSSSSETNNTEVTSVQISKAQTKKNLDSNVLNTGDAIAQSERQHKQIDDTHRPELNEWRTPIEFYGKLVDENNEPVEGAQINFDCNDISEAGTSFYHTQSDTNGFFSISHIHGKSMGVTIEKQGYYTSRRDNSSFEFGDKYNHFIPDINNPTIFHLLKKGHAETLVHIKSPLGGGKGFRIAKDGSPLEISLTNGKTVSTGQGDIRVECWTYNKDKKSGQKFDWNCKVSVPGGGIQPYSDEFPFQAPTEGYQASDEIKMPASLDKGWGTNFRRNYFLKLSNGNYARITFEMIAAGDHFFMLESFLNPSGSRNLEFDPSNVIQPGQ